MKLDYSDIIDRERPKHIDDDFSRRHPSMSIKDRAKIFAPFDALRGFDEAIDEQKEIHEIEVRET